MKLSSQSIFCQNVKNLRKMSGLNKKQFAEKLHISVRGLSMIESGAIPQRMGCEVLEHICEEFKFDPYIILCCIIE